MRMTYYIIFDDNEYMYLVPLLRLLLCKPVHKQ